MAVEPPSDRVDAGRAAPLRGLCGGAVLLPGDYAYNAARAAWNLAVDQRPAAIAYPGDPVEVAAARRAGVQAGARWLEAVEAAAPYGLAALHSTAPTVGVVGYSLGGGIGWQHTREVLDRWVPGGVSTGYHPDAWSRLRAVRAAVDPDQALLANHPVPPAQPRPPSPPRAASLIPRDRCGDDATSLRALYGGTLLLPGDSGYDSEHAHPAARRSKSIPCGHCRTELRNVPTRRGQAATAWWRAVTTARRPRAADGWSVPALRGRHTHDTGCVRAGLADTGHVVGAMAPYASGQRYLNFAGHTVDASAGFEARAWDRLRELRAAVDPDGRCSQPRGSAGNAAKPAAARLTNNRHPDPSPTVTQKR